MTPQFVPLPLWVNLLSLVGTFVLVYLLAIYMRPKDESQKAKVVELGEEARRSQVAPKTPCGDGCQILDRKAA